jgi:pilus assembly protein CpaF
MGFDLILPFLRPIEPLLLDDSISEIMGNPDASWWYERDGIVHREASIFFDAGKLRTGLEVIANQLEKKLDEHNPILHAQLPDGSRLAAVIPPVVRPAPALTIRKFPSRHFTVDDLIARGTLTQPLAEFLAEQIRNGKTLLISGGTSTGKTTVLRALASAIPEDQRIVVIEDTSELHLHKPNLLAVECQTDTFKTNITFDDLLKYRSLRFARHHSRELGRKSPASVRQSRHAQPRADDLRRYRSRDRRSRRFRCPCHARAGAPRGARSARATRLRPRCQTVRHRAGMGGQS